MTEINQHQKITSSLEKTPVTSPMGFYNNNAPSHSYFNTATFGQKEIPVL
jgi:hypothetical protein